MYVNIMQIFTPFDRELFPVWDAEDVSHSFGRRYELHNVASLVCTREEETDKKALQDIELPVYFKQMALDLWWQERR